MFCNQCGAENPVHAEFCSSCGKRLEKERRASPLGTAIPPGQQLPERHKDNGEVSRPVVGLQGSPAPEQSFRREAALPTVSSSSPLDSASSPVEQPTFKNQQMAPNAEFPSHEVASSEYFGSRFPPDQQSLLSNQTSPQEPSPPAPEPIQVPSEGEQPVAPPPPWDLRFKVLAQPLPRWVWLVGTTVIVLVLVVLQLTGTDWAAGARQVAAGAVIIAFLIALAAGVRALVGRRLVKEFISIAIIVVMLLILCLVGFTQQSSIHIWQGGVLEGQQQWQNAITEYQFAGEGAPTCESIARVYNKWGEQLSSTQHYADAMAKFDIILNSCSSATSSEVSRAQLGKVKAYFGWGKQAMQQHGYVTATSYYDALLNLPYCTTDCQAQANALDATAYYNLAESNLAAQRYAEAINVFQTILTRFPGSSEAQKLHEGYAKALWGQGQQQLTNSCSSAIPTYQELSTNFGDTPEGQQATGALKAPQPVSGRFTTSVLIMQNGMDLTPQAALLQNLDPNMPDDQFFNLLDQSPTVTIQKDGSFLFKPLPQGTYDLVWGTVRSDGTATFTYTYRGKSLVYVATVGPLCAYSFGDINKSIPVP